MFSCFFAHLIISNWVPDIVNFILLDTAYFFIPISSFKLGSGMQLSNFGTFGPLGLASLIFFKSRSRMVLLSTLHLQSG